jgi:hypothetical protein
LGFSSNIPLRVTSSKVIYTEKKVLIKNADCKLICSNCQIKTFGNRNGIKILTRTGLFLISELILISKWFDENSKRIFKGLFPQRANK